MKLYRFSPIENQTQLFEAFEYIHFACHELCLKSLGKLLPDSGSMGLFSHYEAEFQNLISVRDSLTVTTGNINGKYFRLVAPIVFAANNSVPETTYTHLYIRQPDPYRHHAGDIDFYLPQAEYEELKKSVNDKTLTGARLFPRNDLDMIELFDPDSDVLAYVNPRNWTLQG